MNSFKAAAIKILEEKGTALHYKEITRLALDRELISTDGKTPSATMNAQLITDVNKKGENSDFIKTAPATFALNPRRPKEEIAKAYPALTIKREKEFKIGSGFTGKAGEHYVTSELLFRGYNASIMSVDVGMDIIATKNNKLFSLQVKTSNLNSSNGYIFDMRKVSLERDYAGNVFYIFVMLHPEGDKSALILPSHKIDELIHTNAIKDIKTHDRFRATLKIRKDKIYLGTLTHEIGYYWDNWEVIK